MLLQLFLVHKLSYAAGSAPTLTVQPTAPARTDNLDVGVSTILQVEQLKGPTYKILQGPIILQAGTCFTLEALRMAGVALELRERWSLKPRGRCAHKAAP